jgi:hypothetical protein
VSTLAPHRLLGDNRHGATPLATTTRAPGALWMKQSNKRMQLTKLRAAPVRAYKVPPCAPAGGTDGGTASQLIRSVGPT